MVVAVAAVATISLLHALSLERRLGALTIQSARAQTDAEDGRLAQAQADLASARATLTGVSTSLYNSPDFKVLNLIPVARENLAAARTAVNLGLQVVSDGEQILHVASPLETPAGHLNVSLAAGQIPLATVQDLQRTLSDIIANLPVAVPPKGAFVFGKVHAAEQRVYAEAVARRSELTSVNSGLELLNELTGGAGDRRYLIAVANEAEMRGAGGMILSYGVLTSHAGKVTLSHVGPIDELALTHPAAATFPADFTKTFAALGPTQNWRNATLMSDFTVDGPVLASMYHSATGLTADGVIQVDSTGLAAVLAGTGPVATPDLGLVTSDNVVPLTLNQAYVQFPDRPVRQEYLTEVAKAAFGRLTTGTFPSLRPLATALIQSALQRHIQFWAADPGAEANVAALGFNGSLPAFGGNFAQLTVQNFGGDKMDYYLSSAMTVTGPLRRGTPNDVTLEVDLADTAPAGGRPPYIFGPTTNHGDPPGEYRGLVTVYLPRYTYLRSAQGDATTTDTVAGSQNGVATLSWTVAMAPGASSHMLLHVQLPEAAPGRTQMVLIPQPRLNATVLKYAK